MAAFLNDSELDGVLANTISWETFLSARLISDKDLQLIRRYDKRTAELRATMLDEVRDAQRATERNPAHMSVGHAGPLLPCRTLVAHWLVIPQAGPAYVEAFVAVLKAVSKEDTVQYVLALLVQLLQGGGPHARRM
jgi:V-type H+-transporting ATPase subunit H